MGTLEALRGAVLGTGTHRPAIVADRLAPLVPSFRAASREHGIPASLLAGIAIRESSLRPGAIGPDILDRSGNPTGIHALGLMQITPGTARAIGLPASFLQGAWRTPSVNIDAGARVLLDKGYRTEPISVVLARYGGFVTADPSDYIEDVLTWAGALIPTFLKG